MNKMIFMRIQIYDEVYAYLCIGIGIIYEQYGLWNETTI